ncbi:MAG TPA: DUF6069 family protein [Gaiellales bacterium]|jgi:phosphatidylserine synthase
MTQKTRIRLLTIVIAPIAALAAWGVFRLAGVDLVTTRGSDTSTVGAPAVVIASLVAALLAVGAVRVIERHSRQPRRAWSLVSSTALAVSMIGPSYLADGGSAVALIALHVVTAVVVVGGPMVTLPPSCGYAGTPYRSTIRS